MNCVGHGKEISNGTKAMCHTSQDEVSETRTDTNKKQTAWEV